MAEDLVTYPVTTEDGRTFQFKAPRGASQGDLESAAESAYNSKYPDIPKLRELPGLEGGTKGDVEQTQKVIAPRVNKPAQASDPNAGYLPHLMGALRGIGHMVTHPQVLFGSEENERKARLSETDKLTSEGFDPYQHLLSEPIVPVQSAVTAAEGDVSGALGDITPQLLMSAGALSPKLRGVPKGIAKGFQKADYPKPTMQDLRYSIPAAVGGLASLARGNSIWGGLLEGGLAGLGLKAIPPMLKSMAREIPNATAGKPWLEIPQIFQPKAHSEALTIPKPPTPEAPTWPTRGMDPELENYPLPTIRPETTEPPYSPWNPVKYRGAIGNLPGDVSRPVSGATWPNLGADAAPEDWGPVAQKLQEISPYQEAEQPTQPNEKYNLDLLTQNALKPPISAGQGRFTARGPIQAPIIDPRVIKPASELKMPDAPSSTPKVEPKVEPLPKSKSQQVAPVMGSINNPLPERVPVKPPIASGATGSPAATTIPAGDKNIMDFVSNLSKKPAPAAEAVSVNKPVAEAPKSTVTVKPPKKAEARDPEFNVLDNLIKKGKGDEPRVVLPPETPKPTVTPRSAPPVNRKDIVDFSGNLDHVTANMIASKLPFAVDDVSKSLKALTEQGYFEDLGNGRYKPTKLEWGKHLPESETTAAPKPAVHKKESLELADKAIKKDRLKDIRETEAARERVTEDAPEEFSQDLGGKLKDYINEKTGGDMKLKTVMRRLKELGYKVEAAGVGPEDYGAGSYKEGKYIPHESRKTPVSSEELASYREEQQVVKEYLEEFKKEHPDMYKGQKFKVHGDTKARKTI